MSVGQIFTGVVVVGAFAVLLANNATQQDRNAVALADAKEAASIPTFSQQVNAAIVAAAKPASVAPMPVPTAPGLKAVGAGFRTIAFTFPASDRALPAGPGVETVTNNCTACHSAGMILTQPQLTKATWTAEVTKMQHTYMAPIADEDVAPIVAYLAALPVAK